MKKEIKLYNTLTRRKDIFESIKPGEVRLYSCGATVYGLQHIGNMRTYIFADVLKRTLTYNGYNVFHVKNYTDVGHLTSDADTGEDKVEMASKKEGKTPKEITTYYIDIFESDLKKLNIIPADVKPKATEHIKEQIDMIQILENKGYTYQTNDGIYFDTSKFPRYKDFGRLNIEGMTAGKRVDLGEKKNITDFALWKFSREDENRLQEWSSPWGIGFPGWHIECSAMAHKYLGEKFDIHTGGEDHIQVHHSNEIAQSESAFGISPYVNFWMHGKFLKADGEKISKSKGSKLTVSSLEEQGINAIVFRYFCLNSSYRKQTNFSIDILRNAQNSYNSLERTILDLKEDEQLIENKDKEEFYKNIFLESINNDLNMPKALSILNNMLRDNSLGTKNRLNLAYDFDKVFGLGLESIVSKEVEMTEELLFLIDSRLRAKEQKNYEKADNIRDQINKLGYNIKDTTKGTKLERI